MKINELIGKEINHKRFLKGEITWLNTIGVVCSFENDATITLDYKAFGKAVVVADKNAQKLIEKLAIYKDKNNDNFVTLINDFIKENSIKNKTNITNFKQSSKKTAVNKRNVLFVNIAYMKEYKGITELDKPINGGAYINETANAGEKNNFLPRNDGMTIGFAEPGHTKGGYDGGGKHKQVHIEKINPDYKDAESIPGVTVIQCAKNPERGKTVIVGWYDNATVYREVKQGLYGNSDSWRSFECRSEDAHLIKENDRNFVIPRATKDGYGIGQSNYWYANKEDEQEFVKEALEYIDRVARLKENKSNSTTWITACNLKKYDVFKSFENSNIIDWKQSTNVKVGDIVYIYVSSPISEIRFKCKAIKVNISKENAIQDEQFIIDGTDYVNSEKHMRLELLFKFDKNAPTIKDLNKFFNGNVQGPRKIDSDLVKFLLDKEKN